MINAVGYIRKSSDKQEASPKQQREEIIALAGREGYKLIRWYMDEGISGDATEKRLDFQRMIRDSARGDFQAVVCWDQDRFGRFDSIEAGHWIHLAARERSTSGYRRPRKDRLEGLCRADAVWDPTGRQARLSPRFEPQRVPWAS